MTGRVALLALLAVPHLHAEDSEALFVRRIAPLFHEKCLACHGDDEKKIKGGLDMRTRAATLKGGESEEPGFVAGLPEKSPLYLAVTRAYEDEWEPMPPKEADKLSAEQIGWIKEWIAGGAPWPDEARMKEIARAHEARWSAEDGRPIKTSGGLAAEWTNRKYKPEGLWAYQPVKKPTPPVASGNPIDALIAAKMPSGLQHELVMKLRGSFLTRKALSRLAMTVTSHTLLTYDLSKPPLNKVALKP